jgi:hypothetical protein
MSNLSWSILFTVDAVTPKENRKRCIHGVMWEAVPLFALMLFVGVHNEQGKEGQRKLLRVPAKHFGGSQGLQLLVQRSRSTTTAFFGKVLNSKKMVKFLVNCARRSGLRCSSIHKWMRQTLEKIALKFMDPVAIKHGSIS